MANTVKKETKACEPAIKLARPVTGYNPVEKMIEIHSDLNQPEKATHYLEVCHRVDWFNLWCMENKVTGYIDDTNVTYDQNSVPGFVLARCDCTVTVDGTEISRGMATRPFLNNQEPAYYRDFVQGLCTTAKGRALANAGFNVPGGATAEDGQMQPAQPVQPTPAPASQEEPVAAPQVDFSNLPWMVKGNTPTAATNAAAVQRVSSTTAAKKPEPKPEEEALSLEDALNCPVTGIRALGNQFTVKTLLNAEAGDATKGVSGKEWVEYLAGRGKKASPIENKNPKLFKAANVALDSAN